MIGGTSLYRLYESDMGSAKGYGFTFGLKLSIDFNRLGLKPGMVLHTCTALEPESGMN